MKLSKGSVGMCNLLYTRALTGQPSLATTSSNSFGYLLKVLGMSSALTVWFPVVVLETPCVLLWVWPHVKTQRRAPRVGVPFTPLRLLCHTSVTRQSQSRIRGLHEQ